MCYVVAQVLDLGLLSYSLLHRNSKVVLRRNFLFEGFFEDLDMLRRRPEIWLRRNSWSALTLVFEFEFLATA